MKALYILIIILSSSLSFKAQNKFSQFPFQYNSFISRPDISWAAEMFTTHSFSQQQKNPIDIHAYLVNAQKSGKIKSYVPKDFDVEALQKWITGRKDDYYIEVDKEYNNTVENLQDSLDLIGFNEIFYLQDHRLRSQVISAGPQYKVVTSFGMYLGNTTTSFSSLHFYSDKIKKKRDDVYFLGSTYSVINFDSVESVAGLKRTYNMSLALNLWYDLSKGYNKVTDIKTNTIISPARVFDYSPFDSLETTIRSVTAKVPGAPAYAYFIGIGITEHWYYNKTRDVFYTEINNADLYINYQNTTDTNYITEKRFEISFDK